MLVDLDYYLAVYSGYITTVFILVLTCGFVGANIASNRNKSALARFVLGACLNFVGLAIISLLGDK